MDVGKKKKPNDYKKIDCYQTYNADYIDKPV
jgi:hypothetical protein